jgi:hypothetical protein
MRVVPAVAVVAVLAGVGQAAAVTSGGAALAIC